jgi:hypothetical protein
MPVSDRTVAVVLRVSRVLVVYVVVALALRQWSG